MVWGSWVWDGFWGYDILFAYFVIEAESKSSSLFNIFDIFRKFNKIEGFNYFIKVVRFNYFFNWFEIGSIAFCHH